MKFNQLVLIGLLIFLLAVAWSIRYQSVVNYLFSDEAVYYMMAQSLAFDRDTEYTKGDLIRFYKDWHGGPQGVFLTRVVQNGQEKIYYGKPLIYPLFLAPFVFWFGLQGFLVFNSLLLVLMVTLGYLYLKRYNPEQVALLFSLTFFLVTASFIYTFWSTPEVFNMFLITSGLFLLFYEAPPTGPGQGLGRKYLSAILLGLAAASKPSNGIFILPVLVGSALSRTEVYQNRKKGFISEVTYLFKRYRSTLGVGFVFLLVIGIFYGIQFLITGQWNAYAGDRRTFYWQFPLQSDNAPFAGLGEAMTNDVYFEKSFYFNPKVFLYNLFYYLFGRFTGLLPYFFPALVSLFCFGVTLGAPLRGTLLGAIGVSILAFILMAPGNYHGGSGAVGNRFFVSIYPAFLFLVTRVPGFGTILATWGVGLLFLAQILINPFYTSYNPAQHAFRFPYKMLPAELTVINALPININPSLVQRFSADTPSYDLYFLNDNSMGRTREGFWVRGEAKLEAVLKAREKQDDLLLVLENGPFENTVEVTAAGTKRTFHLDGDERREVAFPLKTSFPFFTEYLYPITIKSRSGFIPRFAYEDISQRLPRLFSLNKVKDDTRYLGCLIQISLNPGKIGLVYQKKGDLDKAIFYLEQAVGQEPENLALQVALGEAYQRVGRFTKSRIQLERAKQLIPTYVAYFTSSMGKEKPSLESLSSENGSIHLEALRRLLTQTFEAEDLQRTAGSISLDAMASGSRAVSSQPGPTGQGAWAQEQGTDPKPQAPSSRSYLIYGPFQIFPPGAYQVKYRLKIKDPIRPSGADNPAPTLALLDVNSGRYGVLAKRPLRGTDFISPDYYQDFSLDFVNPEASSLEFRVETLGAGSLTVDKVEVYPLLPFQIFYWMGVSYAKEGAWDQALDQFLPLFEADPGYPNLSDYIALGWARLKKWDEALKVLQNGAGPAQELIPSAGSEPVLNPARRSSLQTHNGILASLYEEGKANEIPPETPLYKYLMRVQEAFQPRIPVQITFDNQLALVGYDLPGDQFKPSEVVPITYYWKALAEMSKNYAIFVHFSKRKLTSSDFIRKAKQALGFSVKDFFQQDHFPLEGMYTTDRWLAGEIVKESHQLEIPPSVEPGRYEIWVGVWDPKDTRQRLKAGGQDKVKIGEIEIKKD